MKDRMDLQNDEFDALDRLCRNWNVLKKIAVVDDEYPAYRGYYESSIKVFIEALRANGRIV